MSVYCSEMGPILRYLWGDTYDEAAVMLYAIGSDESAVSKLPSGLCVFLVSEDEMWTAVANGATATDKGGFTEFHARYRDAPQDREYLARLAELRKPLRRA